MTVIVYIIGFVLEIMILGFLNQIYYFGLVCRGHHRSYIWIFR